MYNVSTLKDIGLTIMFAIYAPANGLASDKVKMLELVRKDLEGLPATYAHEGNLNVILSGDFNLNLDQLGEAAGHKLQEIILLANLVDTAAEFLSPPPPSFHPTNVHKKSSRIDGLFFSQGLLNKLSTPKLSMVPWNSDHLTVSLESRQPRPRPPLEPILIKLFLQERASQTICIMYQP